MINIIRTCPRRGQYLQPTIDNLLRSNGGTSRFEVVSSDTRTANENGFEAIRVGVELSNGEPFVFLEDDVDFIDRFDEAAEAFYRDCAGLNHALLPLCANYGAVMQCRGMAWKYRVGAFYGTQAFIISSEMAKKFLDWATLNPWRSSKGFDLYLKKWAESMGEEYFRTPYRSFVQHMGKDSALHPGRFHDYPSWPGRDWRYGSSGFSMLEQAKRPFDAGLCDAIIGMIDKRQSVYDVGCSTGQYIRHIISKGFNGKGFEVTPGMADDVIEEVDFSRPQRFTEQPGTVICLEVGEHIPKDKERYLLKNLAALTKRHLILSWAVPGQGGKRHVNERPRKEVHALMERLGFKHREAESKMLMDAAKLPWFKQTIGVYDRKVAR